MRKDFPCDYFSGIIFPRFVEYSPVCNVTSRVDTDKRLFEYLATDLALARIFTAPGFSLFGKLNPLLMGK
jgi:hypothetical protein